MRQHLKAIVWPRGKTEGRIKGQRGPKPLYRYVIVRMLVTDHPVAPFEGKNEVVLNGATDALVEALGTIKRRRPRIRTGDATNVLLNLTSL